MLVLKFLALLAAGATAAAAISLRYEDFEPVNMNRKQVRLFSLFYCFPCVLGIDCTVLLRADSTESVPQ